MWLTSLFSSEKIVNKSLDIVDKSVSGIGTWIDNMSFTEQEKAQFNKDILDFRLRVLEKTNDESSVRSISRRIIAWAVVGTFLGIVWIWVVGTILQSPWVAGIVKIAELIYSSFLTVVSFYFVGQIGNIWIEKGKK